MVLRAGDLALYALTPNLCKWFCPVQCTWLIKLQSNCFQIWIQILLLHCLNVLPQIFSETFIALFSSSMRMFVDPAAMLQMEDDMTWHDMTWQNATYYNFTITPLWNDWWAAITSPAEAGGWWLVVDGVDEPATLPDSLSWVCLMSVYVSFCVSCDWFIVLFLGSVTIALQL